jgi:hypothetical protein
MSPKLRASSHNLRPAVLRASLLGALVVALAALGSTGCEDKAIGRPCDVLADAGAMQAVFNAQALECPSRICLKPVRQEGVTRAVNTVAYCSAECSKDSDCEGESRDPSNGRDRRCETGFVCGVGFEVGPLCCKKLCLCKDFLPAGTMKTPLTCDTAHGGSGCQ